MIVTLLARVFDERFLRHRLRSTSIAGIAGGCLAGALFLWHYYVENVLHWELVAILATMVVVKWAVMAWSLARE